MLRKEKIITRMFIGSLVALSTLVTSLGPVYAATVDGSNSLTVSVSRPADGSTVAAVQGQITRPDGKIDQIGCTAVKPGAPDVQLPGSYDLSSGTKLVHVHLDKYSDDQCTTNLNQPIDMDLTQPGAAVFTMLVY
jgi:hypothetical protein